jgi:hypothetical protein
MRAFVLRVLFGTATLAASVTVAQTHKVAKPDQVVRAVGVYEWTGDFAKPTASRLIPVSLYIEGRIEDAGIYIARPIPFALLPGNVYLLQSAGIDKGTLDLAYARHLQAVEATGDLAFDDGWFGYGSVKPLAAPRNTVHALKPSQTLSAITTASSDPNRPHLTTKSGDTAPAAGSDQTKPAPPANTKPDTTTTAGTTSPSTSDDPNRPTMKRRSSDPADSGTTTTASNTPPANPGSTTNSTTGSTTSSTSTPADDPDRPTMKRRSDTDTTTTTTSTTPTGSTPADDPDRPTMKRPASDSTTTTGSTTENNPDSADDPDRPTLKRHTVEDAKKAKNGGGPTVTETGSLNDDPTRPNLHRGKPTSSMNETDLPKLTGLPPNLHQMVAVSDAVNRDPHPFTLEWDDEAQHQAILKKMQDTARAQLAAYGAPPAPAAPTPSTAAKKPAPATTHSRRPATPPLPLLDEELKAYMLSYGGAATYVYSANTGGTGAALRYVTIVAQADGLGDIKPAIQSVTDATHLNRTPKMQFVDVVDAEASNRASLLFELRSQNARQFALYRVIASHPEQIFLTGTTQ